jgi:hypothetical protein
MRWLILKYIDIGCSLSPTYFWGQFFKGLGRNFAPTYASGA